MVDSGEVEKGSGSQTAHHPQTHNYPKVSILSATILKNQQLILNLKNRNYPKVLILSATILK